MKDTELGKLNKGQKFRFYNNPKVREFEVFVQRKDNVTWYRAVESGPFECSLDWLTHDVKVFIKD